MEILFKGLSCFLIKTSPEKGREVKLLIDPIFEDFKKKPSPLEADILLLSPLANSGQASCKGSPFLITGEGEYETKEIFIRGMEMKDNTIYLIESEGITICYLNSLAKRGLDSEVLENIGNVDILMVPVGGALGPEGAAEIISQIEPKIVLPMEYQIPILKTKRGKLQDFLKVFGIEKLETLPKLNIKWKKLPEKTEVVILNP